MSADEPAVARAPVVSAEGLSVVYERSDGAVIRAVSNVSFAVGRSELFGLVGESGSGKTTTALALLGLLPSNATVSGNVMFGERNILEKGERSSRAYRWTEIAMVFQGAMGALNPVRKVGRQIVDVLEFHGRASGRSARARTQDLLEQVGLSRRVSTSYPHELSGGMRQRAMIAMAIACEPRVLVADEPTTALDVITQRQICDLLLELAHEMGLAVVLVSHDIAMVGETCSRGAIMYAGRIVESGPMSRLLGDARHPYTQALLQAIPDLETGRRVVALGGSPPRLDVEIVGCSFTPRCPISVDKCLRHRPGLDSVRGDHRAACWRSDSSGRTARAGDHAS